MSRLEGRLGDTWTLSNVGRPTKEVWHLDPLTPQRHSHHRACTPACAHAAPDGQGSGREDKQASHSNAVSVGTLVGVPPHTPEEQQGLRGRGLRGFPSAEARRSVLSGGCGRRGAGYWCSMSRAAGERETRLGSTDHWKGQGFGTRKVKAGAQGLCGAVVQGTPNGVAGGGRRGMSQVREKGNSLQ